MKDRIAGALQVQDFYENDIIVRCNEKVENLYLIVEGEVAELDNERKVSRKIRAGQQFGLLAHAFD